MATVKHAISEHDVVVLRRPVGGWPVGAWPAGTTGAVISVYDDTLLVAITGPGGKTLDTIQAPEAQVAVKRTRSALEAERARLTLTRQASPLVLGQPRRPLEVPYLELRLLEQHR